MAKTNRNLGFDGRVFLEPEEWRTYLRRKPVRYVRRPREGVCAVCGRPAEPGNPLQHSHRIAFDLGICELALTPDFLDSAANMVLAHRRTCNRRAELSLTDCLRALRALGVGELPAHLPEAVRRAWAETAGGAIPAGGAN